MMGNVGAAFFRSSTEKCPNCGDFGQPAEDEDHRTCPSCNARFTEYLVLERGQDVEFQNN